MDQSQFQLGMKIVNIFMPYAMRRQELATQKIESKFVHYTSAENALKIVQSKSLWLRDARCMNDYSELEYGYQRLSRHFGEEKNKAAFFSHLNACSPGLGEEAVQRFDNWWRHLEQSTYISCLSEHDPSEDAFGRLSMWRAYSRNSAAVGLIFRLPIDQTLSMPGIFFSPVAYFSDARFNEEMENVLANIETNYDFLQSAPREYLLNAAYLMLVMAALSLKHPGFSEENEWRVIYLPKQFPSYHLHPSVQTIAGIPQQIYNLPLKDNSEAKIEGIDFANILSKVLIGPTYYPATIAEAFRVALGEAGISNAEERISVSQIPLRT